eukprot:4540039-Pleurochrysis_carterae.AAC.1
MRTQPITFHRALAEIGIAEWADIYDARTKEYYTMGELCKTYGIKKSARIVQEYSNVKRLHSRQLQETENGALGVIWGRHKGELLGSQEGMRERTRKERVLGVIEKRRTAECWGGEEYLTKWDNGVQRNRAAESQWRGGG